MANELKKFSSSARKSRANLNFSLIYLSSPYKIGTNLNIFTVCLSSEREYRMNLKFFQVQNEVRART